MVEFDQMWFIFQHSHPCGPRTYSIGVAALGFPGYRSTHPDPRKSSQLQMWPQHQSDTASQPSVFFRLGNRKWSDGAKSGEYGGWPTSSKPQSRTAAIATIYLFAGALSWWNRTPLISSPGHSEMSLVLLFQALNYFSSVGWSGRKQCN